MAEPIPYDLDPSARIDGTVLVGGSPLRVFRLTAGGAAVVEAARRGDPLVPTQQGLVDRLVDAGALHPRPRSSSFTTADVTVVVPAFAAEVAGVVAAVGPVARIVVVDDASPEPIAAPSGAEMVRRADNGGPAAARNTGLALVDTPLVAFVDVDCRPQPGWLDPLLAHLGNERVGLVAPRVVSEPGPGPIARYEQAQSPLDLGPVAARIRAGTRVSYVPGAALLARVDALRQVGGFDEGRRVGEDVDLVWRLDEEGWACRYEPGSVVHHLPRASLGGLLRQRRAYGTSAAPLALRHSGALAPVSVSGWSAGVWGLTAAGWPVTGGVVAAGTIVALARRLRDLPRPATTAARLAGLGHLHAGRLLASALTRVWWPVAVVVALVSRRARRALVVAALAPAAVDWVRSRPGLDPVRYTALRLLDDAAYGVGVWEGAWRARTLAPLVPDLTSWPRSGRRKRRAAAGTRPAGRGVSA